MHSPAGLIVPFLFAFTFPALAHAACVNPGGTGGCHSTIQAAVDAAAGNDIIHIAAGTYVGNVYIGAGRVLALVGEGAANTIVQGVEPVPEGENTIKVQGVDTAVVLRSLHIRGNTQGQHLITAVNPPVSLIVEDCIVTGSHTLYGTAAIAGARVVRRTLVQGAETGIVIDGGSTIEDSVLRGNGYGVMLWGGTRGRIDIHRTEISDGAKAGVVAHGGRIRASITDSTISANASPGIYMSSRSKLTVERTTITGNGLAPTFCCGTFAPFLAGGIWVSDDRVKVKLRSSILFNEGDECAVRDPALKSRFLSGGFNVLDSGTCGEARDTDSIGNDPLLGPLADNGGNSRTHALLDGSPAIARVTAGCGETDQRDVLRDSPCDSGAFEAP